MLSFYPGQIDRSPGGRIAYSQRSALLWLQRLCFIEEEEMKARGRWVQKGFQESKKKGGGRTSEKKEQNRSKAKAEREDGEDEKVR